MHASDPSSSHQLWSTHESSIYNDRTNLTHRSFQHHHRQSSLIIFHILHPKPDRSDSFLAHTCRRVLLLQRRLAFVQLDRSDGRHGDEVGMEMSGMGGWLREKMGYGKQMRSTHHIYLYKSLKMFIPGLQWVHRWLKLSKKYCVPP